MPRRLLPLAVVALVVASAAGCAQPEPPTESPVEASPMSAADDGPLIVSHRGGAAVYPEHSMRGYEQSAADGYLPEMDLRALADGTIVCVHDPTVERTMTGVEGDVADLTREQWQAARVVSPVGGPDAAPVTWDEVLDELAGDVTIVPELKADDPAVVAEVIDDVTSRGLEDSVILQSFDWSVVRDVAAAGIPALYLVGKDGGDRTPDEVAAAGVEYVGPSWKAGPDVVAAFTDAGLKVVPYTVNDPSVAREMLDAGAVGYFTDDPWALDALDGA